MPSKSPAQHRLMEAVAHNPTFAQKVGIPVKVGKDFAKADKGKKFADGGKVRPMEHTGPSPALTQLRQSLFGQATMGLGNRLHDVITDPVGDMKRTLQGTIDRETARRALPKEQQGQAFEDAAMNFMPMGIFKAPGGNWLNGSVENSLKGLKRDIPNPELDGVLTPGAAGRGAALNSWIDKQLTPYVRNDMATEGDPIRLLAEKHAAENPARIQAAKDKLDTLVKRGQQIAAERGVPEEYLTRHRQQVLAAEKELLLAEKLQATHLNPEQVRFATDWVPDSLQNRRASFGQPQRFMELPPEAQAWENLSDTAIDSAPASRHTRPLTRSEELQGYKSTVDKNPWLLKVPPDTPVHYPVSGPAFSKDLGFEHLTDELRNALNPESGLPADLLLKYQDLPKHTVPQVVERVAKINAWRAAQKVEADAVRANNPATFLHKEYPETGMKWVELKKPDIEGAGHALDPATGDMKDPGYNALQDALQYEGDTMRHCVGGYCDDVADGSTRIFSLRDSKGQPHVTIEMQPGGNNPETFGDAEEYDKMYEAFRQAQQRGFAGDEAAFIKEAYPEKSHGIIKQIKRADNVVDNTDYPGRAHVQDFIKSGQWSDVQDLANSGLKARSLIGNTHPTKLGLPSEIYGISKPSGAQLAEHLPEYFSTEDLINAAKKINETPPPPVEGFAQGGIVKPKLINPRAKQNASCTCQ